MSQHVGIVGCSAEGAALCYRTICIEGGTLFGPLGHPEVSMHTHSFAKYVRCLDEGNLQGIADLMLSSARKLAAAGADFLICPDNTIHQAMGLVTPHSPLPWLHIADVVAERASTLGYRRLGITGTRWLLESEVYPSSLARLGLGCLRPLRAEREEIQRIIMSELVRGIFNPQSTAYLERVVERMKKEGCDAIVLGCTELPLIMSDANSALPTLDSTRLLARAAVVRAAVGASR